MLNQLYATLMETAEKELERIAFQGVGGNERDYLYAKGLLCRFDLLISLIGDGESAGYQPSKRLITNARQASFHLGYYMGTYKRVPEFHQVFSDPRSEELSGRLREIEKDREREEATDISCLGHLNAIVATLSDLSVQDSDPRYFGTLLDCLFSSIYYAFQPQEEFSFGQRRRRQPSEKDAELFTNNKKFRDRVNFALVQILLMYPELPENAYR